MAPEEAPAQTKATGAKKVPTGEPRPKGARAGSKTSQVVAMLQRKNGASLAEIMQKMGWQKHTVRGFMAAADNQESRGNRHRARCFLKSLLRAHKQNSPPRPEPGGRVGGGPRYRLIRYVRSPPSGLKDSMA